MQNIEKNITPAQLLEINNLCCYISMFNFNCLPQKNLFENEQYEGKNLLLGVDWILVISETELG